MQGHHLSHPQLFFYANIGNFIPQNHILRKIESFLDISFLKDLTAPCYSADQGRPSIDPAVFFKMLLIGYLYGISSDRRLCEEITYNLAYRWFCGFSLENTIPHHSSFTRIRDRLGEEVFAHFFAYILQLCKKHGLLKGESIIMDATLVDADACLNSLKPHTDQATPQEIEQTQTPSPYPYNVLPVKKLSNKTHISRTDPDASLAQQKSGTLNTLKYKVHNCIDADSRVIVDTHATTGKLHDSQVCLERLAYLKDQQGLEITEIIADRAYGSAEIIDALEKDNITSYIPLFSSISGSNRGAHLKHIRYDQKYDHYVCSEGKYLKTSGKLYNNRLFYFSKASDCKNCSQLNTCEADKRPKSIVHVIRRNIYEDLYERVKARMATSLFATKMYERRWKIEGIFAEAKNHHCLKRAKYRGLKKVQIQAYMIAIVQNLKRLVHSLFPRLSKVIDGQRPHHKAILFVLQVIFPYHYRSFPNNNFSRKLY